LNKWAGSFQDPSLFIERWWPPASSKLPWSNLY